MGFTLLKLSPSCISEIIMVLLRIISGISLLPSLIGFLCAYCISPGYSMDGPLDHYPAYEPLAGFGSLPGFTASVGYWDSPVLLVLCGTMVLCPCYSTVFVVPTDIFPLIFYGL